MRSSLRSSAGQAAIAAGLLVLLAACGGPEVDDSRTLAPPDDEGRAGLAAGLLDAAPEVRLTSVIGLALHRDQATADALARAADDLDPGVRTHAREALRILADDGIVPRDAGR